MNYPLTLNIFIRLHCFFSPLIFTTYVVISQVGFKGDARQPKKDTNTTLEVPADQTAQAKLSDRVAEDMKKHLQIR